MDQAVFAVTEQVLGTDTLKNGLECESIRVIPRETIWTDLYDL